MFLQTCFVLAVGVELPELLPCGYLVGDNLNISLLLRGIHMTYSHDLFT